ncbi:MAG: hypothetical protein LC127_01780 [Chitinophagales bacterium]|nr:hypothetical protein [Chitinophagales bacterium]
MKEYFKFREVNFTPSTNRVILKCNKFATYKQPQRFTDLPENEGKDPQKDEMVTEIRKVDVKYYYQIMDVVALPADDKSGYKVGDKVLVDFRGVKKFDLYKDLYWAWLMDIAGKINE